MEVVLLDGVVVSYGGGWVAVGPADLFENKPLFRKVATDLAVQYVVPC